MRGNGNYTSNLKDRAIFWFLSIVILALYMRIIAFVIQLCIVD